MSSVKLDTLIDEFPEESEAVLRLANFINEWSNARSPVRTVTTQRIYDIVHPSSQRVLVKMLMRAIEYGYLEKVLRVESEARGGIGDFKSLLDIPSVMFDNRLGHEIEVRPDQIRLLYRVHRSANAA